MFQDASKTKKTALSVIAAGVFTGLAATGFTFKDEIAQRSHDALIQTGIVEHPAVTQARAEALAEKKKEIAPTLNIMNQRSDAMVVEEFARIYPDGDISMIAIWQERMHAFNEAFLLDDRSAEFVTLINSDHSPLEEELSDTNILLIDDLDIAIKTNFIGGEHRFHNGSHLTLDETGNSVLTLSLANQTTGGYEISGIVESTYFLMENAKIKYDEYKNGANATPYGMYDINIVRNNGVRAEISFLPNDLFTPEFTPGS